MSEMFIFTVAASPLIFAYTNALKLEDILSPFRDDRARLVSVVQTKTARRT